MNPWRYLAASLPLEVIRVGLRAPGNGRNASHQRLRFLYRVRAELLARRDGPGRGELLNGLADQVECAPSGEHFGIRGLIARIEVLDRPSQSLALLVLPRLVREEPLRTPGTQAGQPEDVATTEPAEYGRRLLGEIARATTSI